MQWGQGYRLILTFAACILFASVSRATKGPVEAAAPVRVSAPMTNNVDGLRYVRISAGSFQMGCVPGWSGGYQPAEKPCNDEETPRHTVSISEAFWLSQTEVTVGAFKRFCAETGRSMPPEPKFDPHWKKENCPMVMVTWDEAQAYCDWAGGRLPTEAEWEYAARAGTSTQFYWGGTFDGGHAWSRVNVPSGGHEKPGCQDEKEEVEGTTQPAGSLKPNPWGLHDVTGNVWEWCADWYGSSYYSNSPAKDPRGPQSGEFRIQRGGSWYDIPWAMRLSARGRTKPGYRSDNAGFRCLLPVQATESTAVKMDSRPQTKRHERETLGG